MKQTKIWKTKTFPTRRGAINFAKSKSITNPPYWDIAIVPDRKGRLIEMKVFKVKYLGVVLE
jgi:hypothetical protein